MIERPLYVLEVFGYIKKENPLDRRSPWVVLRSINDVNTSYTLDGYSIKVVKQQNFIIQMLARHGLHYSVKQEVCPVKAPKGAFAGLFYYYNRKRLTNEFVCDIIKLQM